MRHFRDHWLPILTLVLSACGDPSPGGITAHLDFRESPSQHNLRAAAVPTLVDRLQITALDVAGSTLATTVLARNPSGDEAPLLEEGGTWALEKVPSGIDRVILAKAFLPESADPRLNRALAYVGKRGGITVKPGQVSDIGTLELIRAPVRLPETDDDPPAPPGPVTVLPVASGGALRVTFQKPADDDVAGYVLAVAKTASVGAEAPTLAPKMVVSEGELLAPGIRVAVIWPFQRTEIITLEGLDDGVPYTVLVYAYDGDDPLNPSAGDPLNYSVPARGFGIPMDTTPPGAPTQLQIIPAAGAAELSFVAPGDDRGGANVVAVGNFEIRTALVRSELETPEAFLLRPEVAPPPAAPPGATLRFTRSLSELSAPAGVSFFVGVRAVDLAENPGPIAIAQLTYNATVAPAITLAAPNIGLAGRELGLTGRDFGVTRGTARIIATDTSTLSYPLIIARWSDAEVVVILPSDARSGRVQLTRPDGQNAELYVPVIGAAVGPVDEYAPPFELVARQRPSGGSLAVLYAETRSGPTGALERFFEGINDGPRYGPRIADDFSTVIRGAYSSALDLWWFVAADEPNSMSASFIDSSTVATFPFRLDNAVGAGQVDGLGLAFLTGPGPAPGMVAFTVGGTLRTATVADVRTDRFNGFYAQTSTSAAYRGVRMGQKQSGELLLAHQNVGVRTTLQLWSNPGGLDPNAFVVVDGADAPETGPGIEVVAVETGAAEEFVIAYEAIEAGRTQVRLLRLEDYGTIRGYAPFPAGNADRRLDDLGVVRRNGTVYLAVLSSRVESNVEPSYTEVPLSALIERRADGGHPGVVLDTAPDDTGARLGCKRGASGYCPILLSSDTAALLFLRR